MTQIIETDLKEVLTQINGKLENLDQNVNVMRVDIATLKEGQNVINKRLDSIDTRLNTLIAVAFTVLLGIIAKLSLMK